MRLRSLTATAHPAGNRISLTWENPEPWHFPGVRVMRRTGTFPASPTDGTLVAEGLGLTYALDSAVQGETTYYYALFPFSNGHPVVYDLNEDNRVAALATSPFDYAGQIYALLPALYQRYDIHLPTAPPPGMTPVDATRGMLRRLLDLPGGQLDQLRSLAQALLDQHDVDVAHGELLPLLAQWIGWRLDLGVDLASRRNELRAAPAIYRTVGLVPTLQATVRRILGRESRIKEYRDNVAHSNAPERRTIWAWQRTGPDAGTWNSPDTPLSLDYAHHGRPTAARDSSGALWLFYHQIRSGHWQVWFKTAPADAGEVFGPSRPLSPASSAQLHPSAVAQGAQVWVFWSTYDAASDIWQIRYRTHSSTTGNGAGWSADVVFEPPGADAGTQRRRPTAAADGSGGVWLFWQERRSGGWIFRYARHDGAAWSPAVTFPFDGGSSPRVEDDPVAIGGVTGSVRRLWLFWVRREAGGRWAVVYRTKPTLTPDAADWSAVIHLSAVAPTFDEREPGPAAVAGRIELFWSSNRGGAWSIWQSTFDEGAGTWAASQPVTTGPYTERGPEPLPTPTRLWLFAGSNRPVTYASEVYRATQTVDRRYSGSTTVDTRNVAKLAMLGHLDDFSTYTYATGRDGHPTAHGRPAYDVVGVFLEPRIDLPQQVIRNSHLGQVNQSLREFVPAHVRLILIDRSDREHNGG